MNTKSVLVLLLLSLFLLVESIRLQFPVILFGSGDLQSMELGLSMTPTNADLNFRMGRTYHNLMLAEENKAGLLLVKSIEGNPLLASSWLELSEILIERGEEGKALLALNRADEIAPLSIARLWQGSILALRLGQEDLAFKNFRIVAHADPEIRTRVFETSWLVSNDPEFIFDKVVSDKILPSYLDYLIATKRADASLAVWGKINNPGTIQPDDSFIRYIEFLIDNERSKQAYAIWTSVVGDNQGDSLIWNGSFEEKLFLGGFDWRFTSDDKQGMLIGLDSEKRVEGGNSVKVKFDGKENVDLYHVYQIVPVEPNKNYLFTANVNTENITTKSGIRWEIHCYPNWKTMSQSTKPITGTNDWTKVSMRLQIPENCKDLMVRLRRFKSKKYDKFISGTTWVDDVRLIDIGSS